MAHEVKVEFIGEDKGVGKTVDSVESRTSRMGSTLGKVGKVAAGVFAGTAIVEGAKRLAEGLKGCAENAIEDEASTRKLAIALHNSTGATQGQVDAVEDWISKQGVALGVTDDELRPAIQRLAESTGSVSKAQREASIAMDVSAGTGKSLKVVTEAMMKANNGTTASLSRLGLKTKDAQGNTLTLNQAMRQMAETFHGQAEARANSLQGRMDRLRLIFDETKESIGYKLIPILTALAGFMLNQVIPAIGKTYTWLAAKLTPVFTKVGAYVRDQVVPQLRSMWKTFESQLLPTLRKVVPPLLKIAAVLVGALLVATLRTISVLLKFIGMLVRFGAALVTAGRKVVTFASGMVSAIRNGVSNAYAAVASLPGRIAGLAGRFGAVGKSIISAFVHGMSNAAGVVSGIAGNVWSAVKGLLNNAISKVNAALNFTISLPGPDVHINAGQIPYLAKGTRRFGGGLAVVGEEGPELVALPRGSRVYNSRQSAAAMAGSGTYTAVVKFVLDGRTIEQSLIRFTRNQNRPLQVKAL